MSASVKQLTFAESAFNMRADIAILFLLRNLRMMNESKRQSPGKVAPGGADRRAERATMCDFWRHGFFLVALAMVLWASGTQTSLAQSETEILQDIPGAKDHPPVPRYEGSVIIGYKTDRFAEVDVPRGPSINPGVEKRHFERVDTVSGERTRLLYIAPRERTSLEVMTNYKEALLASGFETLFECKAESCGDAIEQPFLELNPSRRLSNSLTSEYALTTDVVDPRLLVVKSNRPEGPMHVIVFVAQQGNVANEAASDRVAVFVDIVESAAMEKRMVTIDARELAGNLARDGRQAIYGIFFDFDKAEIKPDSTAQIAEMAQLMRDQPELKFYIVGHTDNRGALEYNLSLSQRRADAVVGALSGQFGIAPPRVMARGLGPLAPVTSNESDAGRAKNRRVEIVLQ